ncbi:GMC oxidoreductase-domain-containing protein [Mycena galopus ATCC 62051]|nr:GMC oxidoreductase-domain-containing protein [Mycena galopus ATCC 62051]
MAAPHSIQPEYDLVFAGGGTAACITASRLAKAFPNLSILVLESGPTTEGKKEHIQPGQFPSHLPPTTKTMKLVESKPSEHVGGRNVIVHAGRCVGGGSSVNWMYYNRPSASDFDDWATEYHNEGWSAKELIPLLQKAETYEIDPKKQRMAPAARSSLFRWPQTVRSVEAIPRRGPKIEKDRPLGYEGNDFTVNSLNTFCNMPKWVSSDGRRSDVPHAYVYGKNLNNLSVMDGCLVNRVVVENGVATGVEYLFDKRIYESSPQDIRLVKARKLVVVAGGSMGSPLILERSGIGRKEVLERAGITVVSELGGVGENYQDHTVSVIPYIVDESCENINKLWRGDAATWETATQQWEKDGSGLLGTSALEAAIKVRPRPDELAELGPDFKPVWDEFFSKRPDKPMLWICLMGGLPADQSAMPPLNFIMAAASLNYPRSRGHIHISSADPYAAPDFQCGFLSDATDVVALRWGYKKIHEILRRMPAFRGALGPAHPQYTPGTAAAEQLSATGPVPIDAPNVAYSAEDDKIIDTYIRNSVGTTFHSLGVCAMKPLHQGGVVDSKLNVYGVQNLKVADVSIPPANVHCNTYAIAVVVGEKAAEIIAQELGGSL